MCPYCYNAHPEDLGEFKGMMTPNCTACARPRKSTDKTIDLKTLLSTTPKELRHSRLDPTRPARVAGKVAQAEATLNKTQAPLDWPVAPQQGS